MSCRLTLQMQAAELAWAMAEMGHLCESFPRRLEAAREAGYHEQVTRLHEWRAQFVDVTGLELDDAARRYRAAERLARDAARGRPGAAVMITGEWQGDQ